MGGVGVAGSSLEKTAGGCVTCGSGQGMRQWSSDDAFHVRGKGKQRCGSRALSQGHPSRCTG